MASSSALDLTTTDERETVRIDGVPYQLRRTTDLTLANLKALERLIPLAMTLADQDTHTPPEAAELSAHLATIVDLVLAAPAKVLGKLNDVQRVMIFKLFIDASLPSMQHALALLTTTRPQGGTRSSRRSNASTAATRPAGGPRSRSAISKPS